MQGKRTKAYVDKLIKEKGLPYFDVSVHCGYDTVLRHFNGAKGTATGKEQIFLYSCTKPMTVVCAMRLVEQGLLHLDDLVEKYLPEYANTFLLDENGNKVPTKNKMTILHLFTMSGGLTYDMFTEPLEKIKRNDGDTIAFCQGFVKTPLSFEPGTRFQYSLCHDALAGVVEVITGKRFSEYMKECIFDPLGMNDSGFHNLDEEKLEPLYAAAPNGMIVPLNSRQTFGMHDTCYDSGGAGVISCIDDYVKFAKTMACGGVWKNGHRIIKEETIEQIRSAKHAGFEMNNTFSCVQGTDYGYGLGVRTRLKETEWGLPVGEYGWDGAAGSYLLVDPVHKISIVMGMQILQWPNIFRGEHIQIVQCIYEDLKEEGLL